MALALNNLKSVDMPLNIRNQTIRQLGGRFLLLCVQLRPTISLVNLGQLLLGMIPFLGVFVDQSSFSFHHPFKN